MIPFNPCGFACDVGRKPYTVRARLFADSEETVEIRWYAVPWGTPFLPFESAVVSQAWDDEPWARTGVGEVFVPYLKFNTWTRPPLPDIGHICGDPGQFVNGVTYDPDRNVQYTTQGLPTCCVGGGGVVIGGDGSFVQMGGVVIGGGHEITTGGVVIGGELETVTTGGVVIGGDAWDVIPPPGTDCTSAGEIFLDVEYHRTVLGGVDQWYFIDLTAGTYHITKPGGDGSEQPIPKVWGGTCPSGLVPVLLLHVGTTSCWQFTLLADAVVWLQWEAPTDPIDMDFTVSAGPC